MMVTVPSFEPMRKVSASGGTNVIRRPCGRDSPFALPIRRGQIGATEPDTSEARQSSYDIRRGIARFVQLLPPVQIFFRDIGT